MTEATNVRRRLRIGELGVDPVDFAAALDAVQSLVESKEGGTVFTPNVDHVILAEENPRFRAAYAATKLSLTDGMPVYWASHLLGAPVPEKISGSDLVVPLLERAAKRGWRVFLLGGADGVAQVVADKMTARYPGLTVVGTESPRIDIDGPEAERAAIVARVRETKPDLVLLALGSPKQEIWGHEVAAALHPAVLIGVGASFDFIAGRQARPPAWVSRAGLEWAYRLAHEPKRLWRRYLVRGPRFVPILVREMRRPRGERVGYAGRD